MTVITPLIGVWVSRYALETDYMLGSLIYSSFMIATVLTNILGGRLSDVVGRKVVITLSLILYSTGNVMFIFEYSHWYLIITRAIQGIGAGLFMPSATAYISDVTSNCCRVKAFSIYNMGLGLGLIIGPLVSGFLITLYEEYPFYLSTTLSITSLVITVIMIKEVEHMRSELLTFKIIPWRILLTPYLIVFLGIGVAAFMGSIFPTHAKLILDIPERDIGFLVSLIFTTYVISQITIHRVLKFVKEYTLVIGLILCSTGMITVLINNLTSLILSVLAMGFGLGIIVNLGMVITSKTVSQELRGFIMSIYHMIMYLSMAITPVVLSIIIDFIGYTLSILAYALTLAILALTLALYAAYKTSHIVNSH